MVSRVWLVVIVESMDQDHMVEKNKENWKKSQSYWYLDRRGAYLNVGLLLASAVTISILGSSFDAKLITWPEWQGFWIGSVFFGTLVLTLVLNLMLWGSLLVFVVDLLIIVFAIVSIITAVTGAGLGAGVLAGYSVAFFAIVVAEGIARTRSGTVSQTKVRTYAFTVAGVFAVAFAVGIIFVSAGTGIIAFFSPFVSAFVFTFIVMKRFQLVEKYQLRAESVHQLKSFVSQIWPTFGKRAETWQMLQQLLLKRKNASLGLAGRRGAGKTDFLHRLIVPIAQKHKTKRLRRLALFVRSPADFEEMSFLSALFEQVALKVDEALAEMIPAVKPHPVMRELQAKAAHQKVLHRIYLLLYVLLLTPVGLLILTLSDRSIDNPLSSAFVPVAADSLLQDASGIDRQLTDSLYQQSETEIDSLPATALVKNNRLYQVFLDSLARQTQALRDSLRDIEKEWKGLLNPPTSSFPRSPHWYESGDRFSRKREINYHLLLDSLVKYPPTHQQQLLDSLAQQFQRGQRRLDSIAARAQQQQRLTAILLEYDQRLDQPATSGRIPLQGLWVIFGGMVMLPGLMWILGRESGGSLHDAQFPGKLSNEIILYQRTQEVLARLRFHHSFGEEQSASFSGGGWGFSAGVGKSKQVTRAQVPFTLLSLVEEYRNYIREVCLYLNRALAEDEIEDTVKIYIAIDELDKVLDTERLHQMLKSIKAIFDLENVYYIISISEDALGTYRLRNVETKNEVDSAFNHILLVPPLDSAASIKFFHEERNIPPALIAPLVVYGVGVPRDMHRLADIATTKIGNNSADNEAPKKWQNPTDCIHYFFGEDQQALGDLISQQPGLSDVWKQKFLSQIQQDDLAIEAATQDNLDLLAEIDLEKFIKSNPGSDDENRKLFFRLRGLVSGYFVKNHLHRQLHEFQALWQQHTKEDFAAEKLPQEIVDWLEARREVAYEISNNPLGAWERLKQLNQQGK